MTTDNIAVRNYILNTLKNKNFITINNDDIILDEEVYTTFINKNIDVNLSSYLKSKITFKYDKILDYDDVIFLMRNDIKIALFCKDFL